MNKLEIQGVSKAFGDRQVLKDVSLTVGEGELVCLLGVSGGGKTTLFNIIAGLLQPDEGRVLIDGVDVTGRPGQVSYMMQKDLLLPFRTIEDNVALPLLLRGVNKREARAHAGEFLKAFGLDGAQKQYPAQLSGGMRQRAAFLRTWMLPQNVILLDEPFSALDPLTRQSVHLWYLEVMSRIHLTTCFITHDVDEAVLLSDRVCLLTGRPGAITHQLAITEPRPRPEDFNLSVSFLDYKREILSIIKGSGK